MTALRKVIPQRDVRTRRIGFNYPDGGFNRHYVSGDLVMSHIVSMLSATFPEGEDFFVRSVRHYSEQITDPELKKQVAGFIGQEVTHGREHRALNERLQAMGYPTRFVDGFVKKGLQREERLFGPAYCLAVTSALEHYTATLAEKLLTSEKAQALLGTNEVRSMLLWHALEESEHKAVAFDVFQTAVGDEKLRVRAMRVTTVTFLFAVTMHTIHSLARDKAARNPVRLLKSVAALRHSPFVERDVITKLRAYNKPGFHPDDNDNSELIAYWSAQLFGEQGTLADHLK
ncbi:metal-dependent hydrolase [Jatrophihabitans sp.]|uniref:metal-dependent hydrolase n=1 Tax=Jatrophihabitans sp. TaxID=1932789 RepID=UPI0030C737ED|nr:metal-dependent hydrolase [Jatrophihabitans sp.]